MSVKKCPETGLWKTDFRVNGKRIRESFNSREEARDFEKDAKLTAKLGVAVVDNEGKPLDEAIKEYAEIELAKKESKGDEKLFLQEFYRFMVHDQSIQRITQIELINLNHYQMFLQNGEKRKKVWFKAEDARKKEFLADKRNVGKEFIPARFPKSFKSLSGSSVNRHLNVVRDLLKWAKLWKWTTENKAADLQPLVENPTERKPWPSNEDVQAAIDNAKPWAKRIFFLVAKTGIRPITAKRLSWQRDVDFVHKRFRVVSKKGNGDLSIHWIPMSADVHDFFLFMWNNRQVGKYSDLVFHSAEGCQVDTKKLGAEMARVTKELNLKGYTLYGFRHKIATDMANPSADGKRAGDLKAASLTLGHKKITQTQRYDHTKESFILQAIEKLESENVIKFRKEG